MGCLMNLLSYGLAFLLDLIFKDIELWPHPVRFIGIILNKLERYSRTQTLIPLRVAGIISLFIVCIISGVIVVFFITLPMLGAIFKVYFAYAGLSLGGLLEKGREVLELCEMGKIQEARKRLSYLVSRDTSEMDDKEILRSLAETLSENFNDGFVAPFFYLVLGGPVLLWIYKSVSTMDSMWGYRTKAWKELGWAGARMDDILGYIPARISFFLIFSWYLIKTRDFSILNKLKNVVRDADKMESPNAGWSMATCAWVFGCTMGGSSVYFGKKYEKPLLGGGGDWDISHIRSLLDFLLECGIYSCIVLLVFRYIL